MKYYVYQHVYKNSSKKRDVQILNENELAKIGFQQSEVKSRGNTFTIEYNVCILGVNEFKTKEKAQDMIDFLIKENQDNIKFYQSWEEYKASLVLMHSPDI